MAIGVSRLEAVKSLVEKVHFPCATQGAKQYRAVPGNYHGIYTVTGSFFNNKN